MERHDRAGEDSEKLLEYDDIQRQLFPVGLLVKYTGMTSQVIRSLGLPSSTEAKLLFMGGRHREHLIRLLKHGGVEATFAVAYIENNVMPTDRKASQVINDVLNSEGLDTQMFWTFAPYLFKSLTEKGISIPEALTMILSWSKDGVSTATSRRESRSRTISPGDPAYDWTYVHLKGLEFLNQYTYRRSYILAGNPATDPSHRFTAQEAQRIADRLIGEKTKKLSPVPSFQEYDDGSLVLRSNELLKSKGGEIDWLSGNKQTLITPEGEIFFKHHSKLALDLLKEIQKMPSYSGLPDQEFIEFMKVHFQWEFLHKGTEGVVFKKQTGDVTVAIKVINSEQLNPHSARSSTAVKAQLLRLFKQECNVEVVDVYACSPNVMVMEYIDAPLLEDYFPEERKKVEKSRDELYELERKYQELKGRFHLPWLSDLRMCNAFVMETPEGDFDHLKVFDLGFDGFFASRPSVSDREVIPSRLKEWQKQNAR